MGYLRRALNYLQRITLFDMTVMMNMTNLITINVETPRINSECSVAKEFTELAHMNP